MPRNGSTHSLLRSSRRTRIVWVSFLSAMTMVIGLLAVGDREGGAPGFPVVTTAFVPDSRTPHPIFNTAAKLDTQRWRGIIIHHSGEPAGDAESMRRRHLSYGYRSMGYHFLVGNGNGLGDGVTHRLGHHGALA